ncbi:Cro/CI family transcriptional regulator [Serratia sp. 201]|uniref:Cro/CI family transcriptional regulator n=1 Tax=Serratia sp. 201 TaxID=3096764 RepID=UPI0030083933
MLKTIVLKFYDGPTKAAAALGITHSAVCQWDSVIPERQAMKLERLTKGKLTYDPSYYKKSTAPAA